MTRKEKKDITLKWLKSKKILFTNTDTERTFGTCDIYAKETQGKNGKKWQFDIYEKHMDINFSTWDENDDMKDIVELMNIPFASDPKQLDSLLELVNFKIK